GDLVGLAYLLVAVVVAGHVVFAGSQQAIIFKRGRVVFCSDMRREGGMEVRYSDLRKVAFETTPGPYLSNLPSSAVNTLSYTVALYVKGNTKEAAVRFYSYEYRPEDLALFFRTLAVLAPEAKFDRSAREAMHPMPIG